MRPSLDKGNAALRDVLEALIAEDVDVSVREVARRHPTLKNASSFTRHPRRMELIKAAQLRQRDARKVRLEPVISRSATMAETLAARSADVRMLEAQVRSLVAATAACIRAVSQTGGTAALERFWSEYKEIADMVRTLRAMPAGGQIIDLPPRQ